MRLYYFIFHFVGGYSTDHWPEFDPLLSAQLYGEITKLDNVETFIRGSHGQITSISSIV